jgi:hypothetical protein
VAHGVGFLLKAARWSCLSEEARLSATAEQVCKNP